MASKVVSDEIILSTKGLQQWFRAKQKPFSKKPEYIKAVSDVSLSLRRGETLGIVGESGCGKTTLGRTIMRLIEPTAGEIFFENQSFTKLTERELRAKRRDMQIIFQDPFASLDPRMTIADIIGEPLDVQKACKTRAERNDRINAILETVGIDPSYALRYAHEFSGGQRQRLGIARAIAITPKVIICDEPLSALDVSIQAQIINLLEEIQERSQISYFFISHDLSVVKYFSNRVAVMYLGRIVELAPNHLLYSNALHPYTQALLSAIPIPDPMLRGKRKRIVLEGDIPSPLNLPSGCCFHTRCWKAQSICAQQVPQLCAVDGEHMCACHFPGK